MATLVPPKDLPPALLPSGGSAAERLRQALSYAVLAPSRHNTQPWIFEVEEDEVRIHADVRRALPATDPDGRELVMACGAAIENLRLAAAHLGFATSLEAAAGYHRDGLLARVRLEERSASTPETEELFQAIPRRRTNRLPLDGREPPAGLVVSLLREARREGASLRSVDDAQRRTVAELVAEGDRIRWANGRYRAELAAWTRSNRTQRRDGMPGYSQGLGDAAAIVQPLALRLWNPAADEAERDRRRTVGSKALVVLSTPRDGMAEWLAAGAALQRVLLRATAAGLCASWFGQVVEVPELRARLRDLLGTEGQPQMMLRLGYGLDVRATPRRPVEEVLRSYRAERSRREALAVRTPPPAPFPERPAAGVEGEGPVLH
jgi:nitroreductase